MPPVQALLAATQNGAKALRRGDTLGTIEEGKLADFVVVDGRPWEDIADLRRVVTVVQDGYVVVTQPGQALSR